jgi:LysR family glycine cleavage system transcriptional activator
MSLLSAFEAAARHQSFTAAAAELNLTQGAISRQIRVLEELLGSDLFLRERQTVRLTSAGESYAHEIREALRRISSATLSFRANPKGGTLNLAILPTFGTRWLAPRLAGFLRENPGITVNLTTRLAPFDFNLEQADAAIHFGRPDWPGAELELLMSETVVPTCSHSLLEEYKFEKPSDLLRAPLLHLVSRPDAWERWFMMHNALNEPLHGMLFDQFATAAQAAISGLGLALLPEFLIQDELTRGDLVRALDLPMQSTEQYYVVWPAGRSSYAPLVAFRQWIVHEVQEANASGRGIVEQSS